ncbi:phosphoribosylamine--glycine ligase [Candidatus Daviesbacteria bacterium]|nr:phosphoribosylamine--glycine ligase [Candidatus Daviesbacteria bacterium]
MIEHLTILIIGRGGREDALTQAYVHSPQVRKVIVAPGNDFIKYKYRHLKEVITDINCNLSDPNSIFALAQSYRPDIVDLACDDPLGVGAADILRVHDFLTMGPNKSAARIESDKKWAKMFLKRERVPTPGFQYFTTDDISFADEYVKQIYGEDVSKLLFVKGTGLCAGKGVYRAENIVEARRAITLMPDLPNDAGKEFLIEEGLIGEEFSYFVMTDGENFKTFGSAQDNKRIGDFDTGDYTGGMGGNSPAWATLGYEEVVENQIIKPVINGLRNLGHPYQGILYLGGIITEEEKPYVIEFNARWGDPEAQLILPGIRSDYVDLVKAINEGKVSQVYLKQDSLVRVGVVGASRGYPGDYSGVVSHPPKKVYGLEEAIQLRGIDVFGAGIIRAGGKFYANGGRLFTIVGVGEDISQARQRAYEGMSNMFVEGNNLNYRHDIAWRDLERYFKSKQ